MTENQTPTGYLCAQCTKKYATDGICTDCNISLIPLYTIDCPECGAELKAEAKHCSHCGKALQCACSNCGSILEAGDAFCADCGRKNEATVAPMEKAKDRSKDLDHINGQELIDLMYNPVGLNEFKKNYPYLTTGPNSEEYETAVERAMGKTKEQPILLRLAAGPRMWAITKPGMIRRLFNIVIDVALWGAIYMAILVMVIGSHKGGGILRAIGLGSESIRGGFAFLWFVVSYFGYTAVAEAFLGSTLGGFICGVSVVNDYGCKFTLGQAFGRSITKYLYPLNFLMGPGDEDYEVVKK